MHPRARVPVPARPDLKVERTVYSANDLVNIMLKVLTCLLRCQKCFAAALPYLFLVNDYNFSNRLLLKARKCQRICNQIKLQWLSCL